MSGLKKTFSKESLFSTTSEVPCSLTFNIGEKCKIAQDDRVGTVAFAGKTSFAPGDWIGLILDKPEGKNDGEVNGVRYFECADKCGIFIRPSKLEKLTILPSGSPSMSVASPTPSVAFSVASSRLAPSKSIYAEQCGFDIGERVIIQGGKAGVCKFLDRINNEITAGILLDRPLGTCNGTYQGIRRFKCNPLYGIFVDATKVKKVATNLPSKVAVRQTKASNLRQGGWKGSQESLNSVGMTSTCSNKFRISPSPKFTKPTGTSMLRDSEMVANLKALLQEKELHCERIFKELEMLRNEFPTTAQSSTLETVSLEKFQLLESKLKESQNAFEKLQTEIYEKENRLEDLSFLLEEAKSQISEFHESVPNVEAEKIESTPKEKTLISKDVQTENLKLLFQSVECQTNFEKKSVKNSETQMKPISTNHFGTQSAIHEFSETGTDSANFMDEKPLVLENGAQTVYPEFFNFATQTTILQFVENGTESAKFEDERPILLEIGIQTMEQLKPIYKTTETQVEQISSKDCGSQSIIHEYVEMGTEPIDFEDVIKSPVSENACQTVNPEISYFSTQTDALSTNDFGTQSINKEYVEIGTDSIKFVEVLENGVQTVNQTEFIDFGTQSTIREFTHIGTETANFKEDRPAVSENASQTVNPQICHSETQCRRPKFIDFGTETLILEKENKPIFFDAGIQTLEDAKKILRDVQTQAQTPEKSLAHSSCQTSTNFKAFEESSSSKNKEYSALENNIIKKHPIELDVSKLDFSNGLSHLEEKCKTQAENVDYLNSQVNFLHSIISDQNKTIEKLKKLNATEDNNAVNSLPSRKPIITRKYCDVCELFDTHDTIDCPIKRDEELELRRHIAISPLTQQPFSICGGSNLKNKIARRAYCEDCESFGHELVNCPNK